MKIKNGIYYGIFFGLIFFLLMISPVKAVTISNVHVMQDHTIPLYEGNSYNVGWSMVGTPTTFNIYIFGGSLSSPLLLASNVSWSSPGYPVSIPLSLSAASNYDFKVEDYNQPLSYAESAGPYTVAVVPTIAVTSPTSSTSWSAGSNNVQITFSCTGNIAHVDIDLLKDGALSSIIATSVSAVGSTVGTQGAGANTYGWNIPSSLSTSSTYQIVVSDSSNRSNKAKSQDFTITGSSTPSTPGYIDLAFIPFVMIGTLGIICALRRKGSLSTNLDGMEEI